MDGARSGEEARRRGGRRRGGSRKEDTVSNDPTPKGGEIGLSYSKYVPRENIGFPITNPVFFLNRVKGIPRESLGP